jgi:ABC-type polysaccharide/polyol phosphate transport system ATPase subunit
MSSDVAISAKNLGKAYHIFHKPEDRLKQMMWRGRRKFYDEFWAVQHISFEVRKGETLGILGRNGSGKSTLLQLICGILEPTEGMVEAQGRIAALLELGAGFNPEFTGRENIFLHAAILGVDKEVMSSRLAKVIEFAGLGAFIDQPMKTYSNGMYARLAFAAAIHVDPAILIVDEALAVGDAGFQLKCMLRMRELKEQGVTILFVSHDTGSVVRLCHRAIVLEKGHIVSNDHDPLKCVKLYEQLTRAVSFPVHTSLSEQTGQNYQTELQGIEETRIGSREAEYRSVHFLGEDGQEREIFCSGEEIEIRSIIYSSRSVLNVVTGHTLKNRAGVDVWGDNSIFAGCALTFKKGFYALSYRFRLAIPSGEYFLYIGLADITGERVELDQRWPVRRLTVVSPRPVLGYVYAPATISLQEIT